MHMEMLGVCPVRADMTLHELKDAGGQALVLILFSVLDFQFNFWLSTFRPLWAYLILLYQQYKWLTVMCLDFS